jgi:hypothetical protein
MVTPPETTKSMYIIPLFKGKKKRGKRLPFLTFTS